MTLRLDMAVELCHTGAVIKNARALLHAIVKVDGEALVLHPGDTPYIVAPAGQIALSSRPLSRHALDMLLTELLPEDSLATLRTSGSVQWELPAARDLPEDRFVVVAAHLDDDPWVEVRRYARAKPSLPPMARRTRRAAADDLTLPSAAELWPDDDDEQLDDYAEGVTGDYA